MVVVGCCGGGGGDLGAADVAFGAAAAAGSCGRTLVSSSDQDYRIIRLSSVKAFQIILIMTMNGIQKKAKRRRYRKCYVLSVIHLNLTKTKDVNKRTATSYSRGHTCDLYNCPIC